MLCSAAAWLLAAAVASQVSASASVLALFAGGMLIYPASVLVCKLLGRPGKPAKANPLGPLAVEGTLWFVFCLPIAFAVSKFNMWWFFPCMLVIIGGRYLTFRTLYGLRVYWVCGAVLAVAACLLAALKLQPAATAFTGAAIETAFAVIILAGSSVRLRSDPSVKGLPSAGTSRRTSGPQSRGQSVVSQSTNPRPPHFTQRLICGILAVGGLIGLVVEGVNLWHAEQLPSALAALNFFSALCGAYVFGLYAIKGPG